VGKYLKYAFGEVILVVLGILIALSINNWNDRRVFKNKVFSQLKTLSKELGDDIGSFEDITFKLPSKIHYLKQLSKGNYEGLDLSRFLYNVAASGRVVSYGEAYKILINNGGINIIENDKLRNNLAVYNDRIRPFFLSKNVGAAEARNIAIGEAKGRYVAFLDSDDVWDSKKLEIQLHQLLLNENPTNVLLYGALQKVYPGNELKNIMLPKRGKGVSESVSDYLFGCNGLMQTSTFFLTATLAKTIAFNPTLVRHQDYDFILRAEHLGGDFDFTEQALCSWICLPGEENISQKGCKLQFAIDWFGEYQQYMTSSGSDAYLSRQMFYIAVKSSQWFDYYKFLFQNLGVLKSLKLIRGNIQYILNRG
jgi:glycosyltransferase involved in cell wall biosynthesis